MLRINLKIYVGVFILLLSTLRGFFFLVSGLPPTQILYFLSTLLIFILIFLFSNPIRFYKYDNYHLFKNLIYLNLFTGFFWFIIELFLSGFSTSLGREFLMIFFAPISILIFLNLNYKTILYSVYIIVFIISISCIVDFWISNVFPGYPLGIELKNYYLWKAIPSTTEIVPARIGAMIRAHGITGSYHDSANILTFCSIFIAGNLFFKKQKRILNAFLLFVSITALISTLSLANIIACFIGLIILNFSIYKGLVLRTTLSFFVFILIIYFFESFFDISKYVLPQLDPSGVKMQAMLISGESNIFQNIVTILIGHESSTGISDLGYFSEIAFVVLLMKYGILVFLPFMLVLTLPIYLYLKSSKTFRKTIFVETLTLSIAVLTLWHYGSLVRSTSIFLFYALYSIVIKNHYLENKLHDKV
ncbi:hypothetical protein OAM76_01650 [Flavobacteriaceae bacterium]|nr:hypothetical protein [Flavobacteriaceae bacterium]MDC3221380.1 hypothetical protein [Flavobacteriaceae bacterium]